MSEQEKAEGWVFMRAALDSTGTRVSLQFACHGRDLVCHTFRPTRCTVRVAAPEDVPPKQVLEDTAALFGFDTQLVGEPRTMHEHQLNAPWGCGRVSVYYCEVPLRADRPFLALQQQQQRRRIALIDLARNGERAPDARLAMRHLVEAELDHARILAPHHVRTLGPLADDHHCSLTRLFEALRGPAAAVRLLDGDLVRELTQIVYRTGPRYAAVERARDKVCVCALSVTAYPLHRLYSFEGQAIACCYEELMARLYGERYDLAVVNALRPDDPLLDELLRTALSIARLAEMPMDEACSGSQLKTSARFLAASYEAAALLPMPRFAARSPLSGKRSVASANDSYRGGLVLPASRELHAKAWLFDFDSHYPSIIAEYRLLPGPPRPADRPSSRHDKVVQLIEAKRNMQQRSPARRAHKLVSVVVYGSLGSVHSTHYARAVADKITEHGRRLLEEARAMLDARGLRTVFGHTDSVMAVGATPKEACDICDTFNAARRHVRLGLERCLAPVLVVNRTQYVGLLADRDAPAVLYRNFVEQMQGALRGCRAPGFWNARAAVQARYAAAIRSAKALACFPGLISGARPRAANLLHLQLLLAALMLWARALAPEEALHGIKYTLALIEPDAADVPAERVALWTSEFSPQPPHGATRGDPFRVTCSRRFWAEATRTYGTLGFAETSALRRHAVICSYRAPGGLQRSIGDRSDDQQARVDKLHWLAQAHKACARHLSGLSSDQAAALESLLQPLASWAHRYRPHVSSKRIAAAPQRAQPSAVTPEYEQPPKTLELAEIERYLGRVRKHDTHVRRLIASELLERANAREHARIRAASYADSLAGVATADSSLYRRIAQLCVPFLQGDAAANTL